jgi:predicted dehydrogenase
VKPLRVAVIGVGHMGRFHAEKVAALARADASVALAAVCDRHLDRARAAGDPHGALATADAREAFAAAEAAIVAVPTAAHAELVALALDMGLDVLVEKPIATTLAEAQQLVALAAARGRVLQVGHLEWFNAAMRTVAARVARPRFFEGHRLGPFLGRSLDIDVVLDLMIHDIDIVQRLVGAEPARVEALGVPVLTGHADICNARLVFAEGCVANLTASRVSQKPLRKLRFFQPDGYFSIDFLGSTVTIGQRGAAESAGERRVTFENLQIDREDALANQLRAFVQGVRDRKPVAGGGDQGLAALRTALRVVAAIPPEDALA